MDGAIRFAYGYARARNCAFDWLRQFAPLVQLKLLVPMNSCNDYYMNSFNDYYTNITKQYLRNSGITPHECSE